jgi:lipopolysaccharide/colanic/teichoic acid biosynthesis glycosyltransferase
VSPWPLHQRVVKRTLDVVVSGLALAVLGLPLLAIGVAIRGGSPGPALFRQRRVGRDGRLFDIWKLRTMHRGAHHGRPLTASGDPRVTPLGRWLRRTKLDELPQLVNVFLGDMSLVGPRPEVPRYVAAYTASDRVLLSVRPGITDPASIQFRDEEGVLATYPDPERAYLEVVLPKKLALARDYLAHQNLFVDLKLLAKTFAAL